MFVVPTLADISIKTHTLDEDPIHLEILQNGNSQNIHSLSSVTEVYDIETSSNSNENMVYILCSAHWEQVSIITSLQHNLTLLSPRRHSLGNSETQQNMKRHAHMTNC